MKVDTEKGTSTTEEQGQLMNIIKNGNIALAFLLEVGALLILAYWGYQLQLTRIARVAVGLAAPLTLMIIWGIWCAPSSSHRLEGAWLIVIKCVLFGLVIFCLFRMNYKALSLIMGGLVMINLALSAHFGTL